MFPSSSTFRLGKFLGSSGVPHILAPGSRSRSGSREYMIVLVPFINFTKRCFTDLLFQHPYHLSQLNGYRAIQSPSNFTMPLLFHSVCQRPTLCISETRIESSFRARCRHFPSVLLLQPCTTPVHPSPSAAAEEMTTGRTGHRSCLFDTTASIGGLCPDISQ